MFNLPIKFLPFNDLLSKFYNLIIFLQIFIHLLSEHNTQLLPSILSRDKWQILILSILAIFADKTSDKLQLGLSVKLKGLWHTHKHLIISTVLLDLFKLRLIMIIVAPIMCHFRLHLLVSQTKLCKWVSHQKLRIRFYLVVNWIFFVPILKEILELVVLDLWFCDTRIFSLLRLKVLKCWFYEIALWLFSKLGVEAVWLIFYLFAEDISQFGFTRFHFWEIATAHEMLILSFIPLFRCCTHLLKNMTRRFPTSRLVPFLRVFQAFEDLRLAKDALSIWTWHNNIIGIFHIRVRHFHACASSNKLPFELVHIIRLWKKLVSFEVSQFRLFKSRLII